ncbi:PepSY domain-containing protein [Pseudomonas sp. PDNC002]|uniref:PepSY-associated TM helix domain-containing protein n=1 Tax=Pseudomonas sp. PDNC002 TaxID=2811422 RepID=UPI001962618A|nr:PepSY domain-containing protein [Pseudomonas sp. PDNC002]QRY81926.1 PepSY domain-containing protein [Pseudomonas sp. PDNC002]
MSKKSRSRLWFLVHSWLALPIWFFVFLVCITGTLATVSQEIVWLADPAVRANAPDDDAQRLGYDQVLAAIAEQQPQAAVRMINVPSESHFALLARVTYPDTGTATLYVNPYTGVIQGKTPLFDFQQFTRALHGWWLVPFTHGFSWGWYLVSLLGLPMLASLVTGLVVYKRFWRGFLKPTLRLRQGARIFWGDVHRLMGIWSIWFIAVISITGTWFLIQAVLFDNNISISSEGVPTIIQRDRIPPGENGAAPSRIGLDAAVLAAQERIPGLEARYFVLPANAFDPLSVGGKSWYPLMFESASVNLYDGSVPSVRLLGDRSGLEFVTESMRPLHTGDFGGLWIKLIWFVFGLILSMMVLSGLMIWSKRTLIATAKELKKQKARERVIATTITEARP